MDYRANPVHVLSADGKLIYSRLLDDGSNVLVFASGFGFVLRDEQEKLGRRIESGWPQTQHERRQ